MSLPSSFKPWHLLCEPYTHVWRSELQQNLEKQKRSDIAVEASTQIASAGAYVIFVSHPESKGFSHLQVVVKGNHGEILYDKTHHHLRKAAPPSSSSSSSSSSSLLNVPQTPPADLPALFCDPFELEPIELHNPNVPVTVTLTAKKFSAPGRKAKSAPQVSIFCNETLSLPMRKFSEAELAADRERIMRELAFDSDTKMVAYASGLIRPFLTVVSMAPPTRQHLAKRLGVSLEKGKPAEGSTSSLTDSMSASSPTLLSSSASSSSSPFGELSFTATTPDSHREAALIVRAMSAKTHEVRASRGKWASLALTTANLAADIGANTNSRDSSRPDADPLDERPFFEVADTPPNAEQALSLSRGFASIASVFGRDCPDWYSCLDETVWSLLPRLIPPNLPVPQSLLLPDVESLQFRVIACRQPVDPLVLSSELRVAQIMESWLRTIRQAKAHRNQRPYLLQFEHVLHMILRGDEFPAKIAHIKQAGIDSPSINRLIAQVLMESWLSRVVQFEGGRDVVPNLLEKLTVDELADGLQTLLYRARKNRIYFKAKSSGRVAALADIGLSSVATGVSAEGQNPGEGVIVGLANAAKEVVRRGAQAVMRKHENALIDVVFEILLQGFILRNRRIYIERYVPGFERATDDDRLLAELRESYHDAIPGIVLSSRLNATDWSLERVLEWLAEIQLDRYAHIFSENQLDGLALININAEQLVSLGIPLGHALRIVALTPRFVAQKGI